MLKTVLRIFSLLLSLAAISAQPGKPEEGAVKLMFAKRFGAGIHPSLAPPQRTHVASLQ